MVTKEDRYDSLYLDLAKRIALMSHAEKRKVGAIAVKNNNILSFGFNGTPTGFPNKCEDDYNKTLSYVIHAEANAILKLARDGESGNGSSLFCTHAPCIHCAKLVHGAGINKVYYRHSYRDTIGLDFLEKCNIEIEKIS